MSTRVSLLPRSCGSRSRAASDVTAKLVLPAPMMTTCTGRMRSLRLLRLWSTHYLGSRVAPHPRHRRRDSIHDKGEGRHCVHIPDDSVEEVVHPHVEDSEEHR